RVALMDLRRQVVLGVVQGLVLAAERGQLVVQLVVGDFRQEGTADDQPDGQGQEDRDDRDQVVAEVDQENSPRSQNTKSSHDEPSTVRYPFPAGETSSVATIVVSAASTRAASDRLEMRLRYRRLTPL